MSDPDMGSWTYTYDDARGNLTRQKDAKGQRICLYYDSLNRLTVKHYRSDDNCPGTPTALNVSYTYDGGTNGVGQRTSMKDSSNDGLSSTLWNYDERGRMIQESKSIIGITQPFVTRWDYNSADLPVHMTYPDTEVLTYSYNNNGQLNSVSNGAGETYLASTNYDAAGRITGMNYGASILNKTFTYYPWNTTTNGGLLNTAVTTRLSGGATLQNLSYTYDKDANVQTIADSLASQTQTFDYDPLNRLTSAVVTGGSFGLYNESYEYDVNTGNLWKKAGITYSYNDPAHAHAITNLTNNNSYIYDPNGNMTRRNVDALTFDLVYDTENRLVSVTGNGLPPTPTPFPTNTSSPVVTATVTPSPTGTMPPTATQTPTASRTNTPTSTMPSGITIGETNILSQDDSGNGNLIVAQQAVLSQSATIQSMSFYVTSAAGKLRLGIYDDASGRPGTLRAQTAEITPVVGWNTQNVLTPVLLPAGTYWLAYLPESNNLHMRVEWTGSAWDYSYTYGTLPNTIPGTPTSGTYHFSFYATLTLGAGPTSTPIATATQTPTASRTATQTPGVPTTTSTPSPTRTPTMTPTATATATATSTTSGAFPGTSILDNFNRANGSIGANWSAETSEFSISSNKLVANSSESMIAWNASSFGADQEAFVTLSSLNSVGASEQSLILKGQGAGAMGDSRIEVSYFASQNRVVVWTNEASQGWVQRGADISITFNNGDQLGARARPNGTVEVYRNGTLIGTRDVTAWPYYASGGYIGLGDYSAQGAILDDFGGGTRLQASAPGANAHFASYNFAPAGQSGGEADTIGVFRSGTWFLKNANDATGADLGPSYGNATGDYPVVGDWDGNGTTTLGVYRNGTFSLRNSNTSGVADIGFNFNPTGNSSGAQPIAGDWDGDGIDTIGIYQSGAFYLRDSNNDGPADYGFSLGDPGDIAVAGDWDGNGTDTVGVFRRSQGKFYLRSSNNPGFSDLVVRFGIPETAYQPLAGDWNSDGTDTIGLYYAGTFSLRNSNTDGVADLTVGFGGDSVDLPVAGNWDGVPSMLPPTPVPSPTPVVPPALNASFVYDGDGNRVKSTINGATTYFVGAHYEVANGVVTKYYYAGSQRIAMRTNGTLNYLLGDHLGSTSLVTDASGQTPIETRYKAWGEVRYASGNTPTKYQYTGQYNEADLGLYYYGARWYDDYLNHFTQPDTIVPDPYNPQSYDRYAYVNNNPLRYTNSSGHCIDGITTVACIIAIGAVVLKGIDYGWTAYDMYQSGKTLSNTSASRTEKMFAGLNIALAVIFEAGEPDDLLPVGVPLDDAGRKLVMKGAKDAFEEGGEAGLEKFLRHELGDYADEAIEKIGLGQSVTPNDLHHIFDKPGRGFDQFLNLFDGNQKSAYNAVWREFSEIAGDYTEAELEKGILVNIKGITIKVRGKMVDGVPRIGTFFIPK